MSAELFQPTLSDRQEWKNWQEAGGKDARRRARDLAQKYIDRHEAAGLTPAQQRDIISAIGGIVREP